MGVRSEIELTGEAMEVIGDYYATLRSRADDSALPITVRTLETVIRLSTAAAKARLAKGEFLQSHLPLRRCQRVSSTIENSFKCLLGKLLMNECMHACAGADVQCLIDE